MINFSKLYSYTTLFSIHFIVIVAIAICLLTLDIPPDTEDDPTTNQTGRSHIHANF